MGIRAFDETGQVMADMALSIIGDAGGEFAVLSASPDAANQNAWIASMNEALKDPKYAKLTLVDTVYGNDKSEDSDNQSLSLVDKHPNLKLIMAICSPEVPGAAEAIKQAVKMGEGEVIGLDLPNENKGYVKEGVTDKEIE